MTLKVNLPVFCGIIGYYLLMNIFMYCYMAYDKYAAIKQKARVPEKNLYLVAFIGGAFGGLLAMAFKRHKTKHLDFVFVFTVTAILHIVAIYFLVGHFAVTIS